MDNAPHSHTSRIDEFTESVEQLWQTEEQQSGASNATSAEASTSDSERGASVP